MRHLMRHLTAVSLFCSMSTGLILASPALAQSNLLPEGQTLITLTVTERTRVGQDTLTADLRMSGRPRCGRCAEPDQSGHGRGAGGGPCGR